MKKIFLLLFLLTCLLSFNFANAGVNETGSSSISLECKKTMLKKYQSDLSVSKSEGKNFLMYASVTENDCVWYQTWPKKEVSKKDHKYAFKKCTKEAKKNGLKTDCFIFAVNDKIVWKNFDKQAVLASKDAPLEKKISYLEDDKKPGRYFKDQPDITNEPQVHFIYLLNKDSEDNEWDINGKMEKELMAANEKVYKMTKGKQKFRYDMREDGKLDISFVRFNRQYKGNYGMNYPDAYLTQIGFNNPNKLYFVWADVKNRDGGQGSVHHGYIFLQNKHIFNANKRMMMTLHEILHVNGFAWPCTKGNSNGHTSSSTVIGGPVGDDSYKLGVLYDHGDDTCPDFKDSVFLDPKSDNPFNPVELKCAMAAEVGRGKAPKENYDWRKRYSHKKLQKIKKKSTWCTYNVGN